MEHPETLYKIYIRVINSKYIFYYSSKTFKVCSFPSALSDSPCYWHVGVLQMSTVSHHASGEAILGLLGFSVP